MQELLANFTLLLFVLMAFAFMTGGNPASIVRLMFGIAGSALNGAVGLARAVGRSAAAAGRQRRGRREWDQ